MSILGRHRSLPARWITLVVILSFVLVIAIACGTSDAEEFQKATPSNSVFVIDDFLSLGFKKDKQYDIEGLPGGVDAWTGFWGTDPYNRKDYELRFYGSHEDAVKLGPALAEEVTGEDALAYRKNPTWEEGAKDRWQNAFTGDLQASSISGPSPKYGDYVIFGNVLLLCEGADSGQGLERCKALVDALTSGETE
jgi:hypothetical protein